MTAGITPITCDQGEDLDLVFACQQLDGTPVDLTGGSARMQVRNGIDASTTMLDLDTGAKGGLTIDGVAGTITLHVAAAVTNTLIPSDEACYDIEFVSVAGAVKRLVQGPFIIDPQVTR